MQHKQHSCSPETPLPPENRQQSRDRDDNKCRLCGATRNLHTHHITADSHHPRDLTTICGTCHTWHHALRHVQAHISADNTAIKFQPSPVDLLAILSLAEHAPITTSELANAIDTTVEATSQRLYKLTALNVIEPSIDLHKHTGNVATWHLRGNLTDTAIGTLPDNPSEAARLTRDEMIRRRIQDGHRITDIATDLGISRRTVYKALDRAAALKPPIPNITHNN